ncbi:MAG: HlyD family secretion protein [Chloroflexia bacterium]
MSGKAAGRRKVLLALALLALVAAAAALAWRWLGRSLEERSAEVLTASGIIEVEEVDLASEIGGRVVEVYVDEGDAVQAGQVLIRLDDALLKAQLAQAEAALDAARAALQRVEEGATPEELAQAQAALAQALATRSGALELWRAAQAVAEDPQQVILQYHAARGLKEVAENTVLSTQQAGYTAKEDARLLWYNAANLLRDAQANYSRIYWRNREQEKTRELTQLEKDEEAAAWRRVEDAERLMQMGELNYNLAVTLEAQNNAIAQANLQTAQRLYTDLGRMVAEPLSIQAQVAQAKAQYLQAAAAVEVARAALEKARAGAAPAEVEARRAQLRQAEAAAQLLRLQLERATLRAPVSGIVLVRSIHEGELAAPGLPLLTLGDLDTVRLTIYLPENLYGRVQLGQQVQIRVDSFPDRSFLGEVVYISPRAEFTPKDVQTEKERVHLVYAVRVRVPNPEHLLKPGMPADAEIVLGEAR